MACLHCQTHSGGDFLSSLPAGPGKFNFRLWGALQNGSWGSLTHSANAAALEGGDQFARSPARRGCAADGSEAVATTTGPIPNTTRFSRSCRTPRIYARDPFYDLMNSTDEFVQVVDTPIKKLVVRADLHWLQLTSGKDLWYQGGGAYDSKYSAIPDAPRMGTLPLPPLPTTAPTGGSQTPLLPTSTTRMFPERA